MYIKIPTIIPKTQLNFSSLETSKVRIYSIVFLVAIRNYVADGCFESTHLGIFFHLKLVLINNSKMLFLFILENCYDNYLKKCNRYTTNFVSIS